MPPLIQEMLENSEGQETQGGSEDKAGPEEPEHGAPSPESADGTAPTNADDP